MWYEALPPAVIVFVLLNIPDKVCSFTNKLALGNKFRRDIGTPWIQRYYTRDWELTGHPYKTQGLEALPDEPNTSGINWQKFIRNSK
ncbi:uncharacterized protein LOC126840703 [Adelges cooleyi]|uniref:uncharacterized protein LOC126840703 n=1 Tax=Adelges cooleyi TaxID=133065 RepID=UPI00217F65D1|nr:uncharacterized protein LOC126840703 [Adelges cooleyi]